MKINHKNLLLILTVNTTLKSVITNGRPYHKQVITMASNPINYSDLSCTFIDFVPRIMQVAPSQDALHWAL